MKKRSSKKKKLKPRLPLGAVLKLRSHPVGTQKGKKGFDRKRLKEQERKILAENSDKEIN